MAGVSPQLELLVDNLDRAYRGRSWHGTSLRGTLRGLTGEAALWRPQPQRHCIWDLVLHAAYWKYVARRKLAPQSPRFPRAGSDFPHLPDPADPRALAADLALLDEQHALLREAVLALRPAQLGEARGSWRVVEYVLGVAAHDLYHAGQINLLKRLRQSGD
ncbi:MAG: DinB family protein [Planctomycetes bacterium]|nr:DinB family protein [Planctomycetota bacterium]MCB9871533.1 DinB family protein [Planctomycetota bacterium]MCB9889432.1 DinB family protein [Planctomycetota bacterium]